MDPFDDNALFGVFDGEPQKRARDDDEQGSQKRTKASKEYVMHAP